MQGPLGRVARSRGREQRRDNGDDRRAERDRRTALKQEGNGTHNSANGLSLSRSPNAPVHRTTTQQSRLHGWFLTSLRSSDDLMEQPALRICWFCRDNRRKEDRGRASPCYG